MSSSTSLPAPSPEVQSFTEHLQKSTRILALLGAGLSASSGLFTFRGAGGVWRNHDAMSLATPDAFRREPGLVWQFYAYRRHMALGAKPNRAHFALAELARKKEGFVTLSQNVDGLSQRAGHPPEQLHLLHGNLFNITCFHTGCDYLDPNNFSDPLSPVLAVVDDVLPQTIDKTGAEASSSLSAALNILAPSNSVPDPNRRIPASELPHCPKCKIGLLRPGVVWFREQLPKDTIEAVDQWIEESDKIDLMLVIGTTARVYPAASYITKARAKGARIAVVNMESGDLGETGSLEDGDWMFEGDAGVIVPQILRGVIGDDY